MKAGGSADRALLKPAAGASIVSFIDELRAAGMTVDIARVQLLLDALPMLSARDLASLYAAGRVTLCSRLSDLAIYDRCFSAFFFDGDINEQTIEPDPEAPPMLPGSAATKPRGATDDDRELDIGAASPEERLRYRNFTKLSDEEKRQVYALIARMRGKVAMRSSRRRISARVGDLDVRRTVRSAMRRGGEPDVLWRRRPCLKPRRRVLLLDISGSMAPYAGGLLRLGFAAHRCAPSHTEVFTIGTRLTRITPYLRIGDAEAAIAAASKAIPDWSGGTRIGDQLKAFLDISGHRGMARGAVLVLASDGWERGHVGLLAEQMQRSARLAKRVLWINPHVSTAGFEPLTRGMQAALPFVDRLISGSTADELERFLQMLADESN